MNWHPTVTRGDIIYISENPSLFAEGFGKTGQHDIKVQIYAEDTADAFNLSLGTIDFIQTPQATNADITAHVQTGDAITPPDNSILTVTATGTDRGEALKRLKLALDQVIIDGIPTSLAFVQAVLDNDRFERGDLGPSFIAEDYPNGFLGAEVNSGHARKIAALWALKQNGVSNVVTLTCQGQSFPYVTQVDTGLPKARVTVDDASDKAAIEFEIELEEWSGDRLVLARIDSKPFNVQFGRDTGGSFANYRGCHYRILN